MSKTDEIAEKFVKHLEETLVAHLKGEIKRMIKSVVDTHVEGLNKRLDRLEKTMDAWKADFDEDRKTLQQLRVDSDHINTEINEIRQTTDSMPRKVGDKVEKQVMDAVAGAVPKAVSDTFDVSSKKIKIEKKPRKKILGIF